MWPVGGATPPSGTYASTGDTSVWPSARAIASARTCTRTLCFPSARCGPFCSVPPVGTMTVVVPVRTSSRTSVQVSRSSHTVSGVAARAGDVATTSATSTSGTMLRVMEPPSIAPGRAGLGHPRPGRVDALVYVVGRRTGRFFRGRANAPAGGHGGKRPDRSAPAWRASRRTPPERRIGHTALERAGGHAEEAAGRAMTLEEYVTWAATVGLEPGPDARSERGLTALGLGLASEVGAGVLVRWLRGEARDRGELADELGDVAYWWARLCAATGVGASTLLARSRAHVEWRRAGRLPDGPASADAPASLEDFAAWVRGTDGAPEDEAALGDAGLALAGDAGEVVECLRKLGAGEEARRAQLAGE